MDFLRELNRRHEALKHRIHSFRIPLSKTGQRIMGVVYFSIPVIAGYFIMSVRTKECDLVLFIPIFHVPCVNSRQAAGRAAEKNLKDLKPTNPVLTEDQKADIELQKAALNKFLDKHNPNKGSS